MPDDNQPPNFEFGNNAPGPDPEQPTQQQAHLPPPTAGGPNFGPPGNNHPPKKSHKGCIIAIVVALVVFLITVAIIIAAIVWGVNKARDEVDSAVRENDVEQMLKDFTTSTVPGETPAIPMPGVTEVTLDEYNQITTGMTYQQVVDIVGGPEVTCTSAFDNEICSWSGAEYSAVVLTLDAPKPDGKVTDKTQYGLN